MKTLLALLVATLAFTSSPAFAACTNPQGTCTFGPGIGCTQLIWDTQFTQYNTSTCENWFGSGWTSYHANDGSDYFWEIQSWGGSVYQQVTVPSGTDALDVNGVIYLVKNTPGTERIIVDITNTSGTSLETLGTFYATGSSTVSFGLAAANTYAGQTVRIRFRVLSGNSPGDTLFHVSYVYARALNYP